MAKQSLVASLIMTSSLLLVLCVSENSAEPRTNPETTTISNLSASDEVVTYVPAGQISAEDMQLLGRPEVEHHFTLYRYSWCGVPWQISEVNSPFVRLHIVFAFWASMGLDDYSELTVIMSRDGRELRLIPIQNRGMVTYAKVEEDPHNIAIFNELLAAEDVKPASAKDWLRLAMLYLNLVGERHQISDWKGWGHGINLGLLSSLPKLKSLNLLPDVHHEGQMWEVRISDIHPDQEHKVNWELDFNSSGAHPILEYVSREILPLTE